MMKEIKLGFNAMKYVFGLKSNIGLVILFLVIGFFEIIIASEDIMNMEVLGCFFLMIIPMFLVQMINSINYTGLIGASPKNKVMQVNIPTFLYSIGTILMFSISALTVYIIEHFKGTYSPDHYIVAIIDICLVAIMFDVYSAFAYKIFWASYIFFIGTFMIFWFGITSGMFRLPNLNDSVMVNLALCYAFIIIGNVLYAIISRCVYKLPFSRRAMGAKLRNEL